MNTVLVPYRPDTPERVGNWERVRGQWEGWHVITADSDGEDFGRAQAINRAAAEAGEWDALVVVDCDLLLEDVTQAVVALEFARRIKGYILCYTRFYYLDEDASQVVRAGEVPSPEMAYYSLLGTWLGTFAIHREAWDAAGGFDERFTSWGGEDGAFVQRLDDAHVRRDRVSGGCYHLAHPKVASVW